MTGRVEQRITIQAPAPIVFEALVTPERLERWLVMSGRVRLDAYEGGSVAFDDPPLGRVQGSVEECLPPERLTIAFHRTWPRFLSFHLDATGEGATELKVVHTGFDELGSDPRTVRGFDLGWRDRLEDLKRLLEAGG